MTTTTTTPSTVDLTKLRNKIQGGILEESTLPPMPCVRVKREALLETLEFLRNDPEYRMHQLKEITVVDGLYLRESERFELVYLLHNLDTQKRVAVKCRVEEDDAHVPSINHLWRAANWGEREAFDQYGLKFDNHPNLKRILNHHEFVGHPLRKDYNIFRGHWCSEAETLLDELELRRKMFPERIADADHDPGETMILNIGPSHPASHGTLRNLVELDGETVLYCVQEIGYLHRGFEKSAETHEYNQVVPYTDRLNYCSAISNNVGYVKAVEELCGIEIPPRNQAIRVIMCELSRIMDHLVCNAANIVDLGALTNFWYLFNLREKIYNVIEGVTGARLTNSYARVGSLWADITPDFIEQVRGLLAEIPQHVDDTMKLVARNRIFIDRTVGIGKISPDDAIAYGYTGLCLRATGYEHDLRKAQPYYGYDQYDFEIPVGHQGDTYDRIMCRFEEIKQSARIVEQALDSLPDGPYRADHPMAYLPDKQTRTYANIEGLVNHFKIVMHGIQPPKGEVYSWTETPNGELGFYIVSDGGMKPYKCKVRPPCFYLYSSFPDLVEGQMVADVIAVLGSLNIVAGELDR